MSSRTVIVIPSERSDQTKTTKWHANWMAPWHRCNRAYQKYQQPPTNPGTGKFLANALQSNADGSAALQRKCNGWWSLRLFKL